MDDRGNFVPEPVMTPAEERIAALLDRWLESLDLHLGYAALDDGTYWKVRDRVEHERPRAWVIKIAKQRTLELKKLFESRADLNAAQLAEALEHAVFLANLLGSRAVNFAEQVAAAGAEARARSDPSGRADRSSGTAEVTMRTRAPLAASCHARLPARLVRRGAAQMAIAGKKKAAPARAQPSKDEQAIMADAVRLLKWGRAWHELAEAIARMSARPPLGEVRREQPTGTGATHGDRLIFGSAADETNHRRFVVPQPTYAGVLRSVPCGRDLPGSEDFRIDNLDGPPSRYVPPSLAESRRDHVQPYASGRFRPKADIQVGSFTSARTDGR